MLSRWEEACIKDLDTHGRVSAKKSIAYIHGFLNRPIVNEYIEFIWNIFSNSIPNLERKSRIFSFMATHDVDVPFEYFYNSAMSLMRQLVGDLVKRNSIHSFLSRIRNFYISKFIDISRDPFNTFRKILSLSNEFKVKSYFNFFGEKTLEKYDCKYNIQDEVIISIIKEIVKEGHQLGFHPSYFTNQDKFLLFRQFNKLKSVCDIIGIEQEKWGGRQHYLKWDVTCTPAYWNDIGLDFDSTLGYYDMPGFRCGTCYSFPIFDLSNRKTLKLLEFPLIAMECSFFDYANMSYDEAIHYALDLLSKTLFYDGNFVILWHNDKLADENSYYYKLYFELLKANKQLSK
jgi:hypothetical protein